MNESERINNLKSYDIMDSGRDVSFDRITKLAATVCEASFAMICFGDQERIWIKSAWGLKGFEQLKREDSFASEVMKRKELLIVEDASSDPMFKNLSTVTGAPFIKFYAGYPLQSKEGFILGVLCVAHDEIKSLTKIQSDVLIDLAGQVGELITLRKSNSDLLDARNKIEEQQQLLLNKARLQTIGELASGVCHQINNPLAIIIGRSMIMRTILKKKLPDDLDLAHELDLIEQTANRVSGILKALRIYAKDLGTEKSKSNLNEVLDDALTLIKGKLVSAGISLNYEKGSDAFVYINKNQISQVLMDLFSNAIESMEETTDKNLEIKVHHTDLDVTIHITDNGKGIREEDQLKIFEPFFTTKLRHFGVGLSNAKNFMNENKGEITLVHGKNPTTFEVKIPTI